MTVALDLFAGTGWGVACQRLGIEEYGVEIMPEARATRAANGMHTVYADVWSGLTSDLIMSRGGYGGEAAEALAADGVSFRDIYDLLIASPPCQTFSMAGKGAGREALDHVLEAIETRAYMDVDRLREFGEKHDPRTALVLTPLAHVFRDAPLFVVFEQVPPVLPVWERCAEEMRRWGYSVWTGVVNSEQYGVPQTRRRAILIARADGGEAKMPTPTHSRYYSSGKKKGTMDEGVLPWVSMAEALGWGMNRRPFVTAGNAVGRAEGIGGSGGKAAVNREKEAGAWRFAGAGATAEHTAGQVPRESDEPAHTLTGRQTAAWLPSDAVQVRLGQGGGRTERHGPRGGRPVADPAYTVLGGEGGNSQPGFGVKYEGLRGPWGMTDRPYPTVASGVKEGGGNGPDPMAIGGSAARKIIHDERDRGAWVDDRPATTRLGDARIFAPGHKTNAADTAAGRKYPGRPEGAERVTVAEAAALQSYPVDFVWDAILPDGKPVTKTKKFLQIGNAVPPLLAEAILREVLS